MSGKELRNQKLRYALSLRGEGASVKYSCKKSNISKSSYYRWIEKIREYCCSNLVEPSWENIAKCIDEALEDKSKAPKNHARKMSECTKKRIINEALSGEHGSGSSIARKLREKGVKVSEKKVIEVLRDGGLYNKMKKGEL